MVVVVVVIVILRAAAEVVAAVVVGVVGGAAEHSRVAIEQKQRRGRSRMNRNNIGGQHLGG